MRKILIFTPFLVTVLFFAFFVGATKPVFAMPLYNSDGTIRYNDVSYYGNSGNMNYYGGSSPSYNYNQGVATSYYGNSGTYYNPGNSNYYYSGSGNGYPYNNQGSSYYYGNNSYPYNNYNNNSGSLYYYGNNAGQTMCPMESKLCAGGVTVGRAGPNCEFLACPSNTTYSQGGNYYYGNNVYPYNQGSSSYQTTYYSPGYTTNTYNGGNGYLYNGGGSHSYY